ncbi:EAL domain, c-di-GMP-specific phosphodiesterase class I (or its enzymatically inactive variant) [Faunimonas pinastri]|uniref:EAL domain, c-di-GMP-specific phosphodiesterase class I (Or its enzymatically inactive variant) n=1 Tax=Faunimonas pinastri TaxID=1855383 RepID=A0A1H9QLA2_9HYPH|nr:EAL domain-containing protein [Faunimonas pinastri]SER61208.1 EAL domain, c-di-GMP-specific phosphodiesterase class I (or its enzymatically inactive variant) [Faunimonas pinastri]
MDVERNGLPGSSEEPAEIVAAKEMIRRVIKAVRSHLGMDVAYVSQIIDNHSIVRVTDAPGSEGRIWDGMSWQMEDAYCQAILEGKLPELMPDTGAVPAAAAFPVTSEGPIGAHISVPLRLPDGQAYGMFCCLSFEPDPTLTNRDLQVMRAFADLTAGQISQELDAARAQRAKKARVVEAVERHELTFVFQPVVRLVDDRVVGFEALARFAGLPHRAPNVWFQEAAEVGYGLELEWIAIREALKQFAPLLDRAYVAVNASPEAIMSPGFPALFDGLPGEAIVLEITEHESITDCTQLIAALAGVRSRGVRIAVDDVGAGYSSLTRLVDLRPDLIKLDMNLVRNIDSDTARRALASALMSFAAGTETITVAEGVETLAELQVLRDLGVDKVQGYYLGRPMAIEQAAALAGNRIGAAAPAAQG